MRGVQEVRGRRVTGVRQSSCWARAGVDAARAALQLKPRQWPSTDQCHGSLGRLWKPKVAALAVSHW